MTAPLTPNPIRDSNGGGDAVLDWFRVRTRYLVIGGAIVAAAGVGYWFYTRTAQNRNARAEQSLLQARQSVMQGNAALAQNDLQNILRRYGGTRAGVEAGLLLAELHYGKGEFQKGIEVLNQIVGGSAAEASRAKIHALIGDGHVQLGQVDAAAQSYRRAAEEARFDGARAFYAARRARLLMAAGKAAEARQIWEELATASWAASVAPEARVRLGELSVEQARRS